MGQFKKFIAETYPDTEDYLIVIDFSGFVGGAGLFMEMRRDPQHVLQCAKVWKAWGDANE